MPSSAAPGLPAALSRAAGAVLPALEAAARATGADFSALFHTARLESGFRPAAKALTSSATGLFQFIDRTWLDTLARHGPRHGITAGSRAEALALRRNPYVASLMAGAHMAENRQRLEAALGRAAGALDLYLAHFLGAGGAARFLSALAADPGQAAAALLPAAARANRAIFFGPGGARSLAEVHGLLARRFAGGADGAPGAGTAVPPPLLATGKPVPAAPASRDPDGTAARQAAQAAYLLLAELGG
jgi:hypothetical protein